MFKVVTIIAFLMSPGLALADDVTPLPAPDAVASSSPLPQQGSGSGMLGPQSGTSSTADGGALQPAGNNPLQSGGDSSAGLGASGDNGLQGSVPNGDLKIQLGNEADGATQTPSGQNALGPVLDTIVLAMVLSLLATIGFLRRRVARRFNDRLE